MSHWIELREHEARYVSPAQLSDSDAIELHERYGGREAALDLEWPSPRTQGRYRVMARASVGSFPLRDGGGVRVAPKVPIANLFRMLEVAYDVSVRDLDQHVPVASIDDLFDRLARRLASGVLRRVQRGLAKSYRAERDRLPFVRGRIDPIGLARSADRAQLQCHFDEHTADIHDNHVLVWTLHRLARAPGIGHDARRHVQRALYAIGPAVSITAVPSERAVQRWYDRLRQDYRPMHVLCRLLLEHAGPTHRDGHRESTAFVIQMPLLFERFVAEELRRRLPPDLALEVQERVILMSDAKLHFDIDLVVRDRGTGSARMVLDTKYKDHPIPNTSDISQIASYALAVDCNHAVLLYPMGGERSLRPLRHVRVRRMAYALDGDLSETGDIVAERIAEIVRSAMTMASQSTA